MKKIIICIFTVLFSASAFAETVVVSDTTMTAWGSPKTTTDTSDSIKSVTKDINDRDGYTRLVYMARKIVPHGGYFCFTVLHSNIASGDGRYSSYHQPTGEMCAWYCESGYAGENCASGNGEDCNFGLISDSDLSVNKMTATTANIKDKLKSDQGLFTYGYTESWDYELNGILAAEKFLDSGHGIIAKPTTFKAGAWNGVSGKQDILSTSAEIKGAISSIKKTLCAAGWSGSDCATPTDACTSCADNRVFIVSKNACSEGTLDPDYPGDKGYSCDGDRKKYMNSQGVCVTKGNTSAANMAANCWKTMTSYDMDTCLRKIGGSSINNSSNSSSSNSGSSGDSNVIPAGAVSAEMVMSSEESMIR